MSNFQNKNRLQASSKTILNFYIKKVPSLNIVNHQIHELEKAKKIYDKVGNSELSEATETIKNTLQLKADNLFSKTKKKDGKTYNAEQKESILKADKTIQEYYTKRNDIMLQLDKLSPTKVYNRLREFRRIIRLIESDKIIDTTKINLQFNDSNVIIDRSNTDLVYQEYDVYCTELANVLDVSIDYIKTSTESKIKTLFEAKFSEKVNVLNHAKSALDDKIMLRRNELLIDIDKETNIVSLIDDVFDFGSELDEIEIEKIKNIMSASYISLATTIAYSVCDKHNQMNNINDAISGALLALSETINKWFEDKERVGTLIAFGYLVGQNMRKGAERALMDLGSLMGSSSTRSNIISEQKKAIATYRKYIKGTELLSDDVVLSLIQDAELVAIQKGIKGANSTLLHTVKKELSETDLNAMIGGEEDDVNYWDIYDHESDEASQQKISEAVDNIKTLNECINKLMGYFAIVEVYDENGVLQYDTNEQLSMFDDEEKLIFFSYFTQVFDSEKGEIIDDVTYNKISELLAKHTAEKENIDVSFVKPKSVSYIGEKVKNIMRKIRIIVEADIDVKRALEYLYIWMKQNPKATFLASNYNELNTVKAYNDVDDFEFSDDEYQQLQMQRQQYQQEDFYDEYQQLFRI